MQKINNRLCAFCLLLITSQLCTAQNSLKNKTWKTLALPNGWHISVPANFRREDGRGVDSQVGSIYSLTDSVTLQFDIGIDRQIAFEKADCELNTQIKKAKREMQKKIIRESYNIPKTNRAYVEIINGRVAEIVVQQKSALGLTGVSIQDCKTGNWIGIEIDDLNFAKQNLVFQIFKSISR